jgi:Fe-Mn family superoxide dismutase
VTVATELVTGTDMAGDDLITIIRKAYGTNQSLFNNAAQSYNHGTPSSFYFSSSQKYTQTYFYRIYYFFTKEFYWNCMKPNGGGVPTGKLAELIDRDFGSFATFRTEFINAGLTAFGSGWAWLIFHEGKLKVVAKSLIVYASAIII